VILSPTVQGMILRTLSGLLFTFMAVCVKLTSGTVPLGEIVFFRSTFAMIPLVIFLWWRGEFPGGLRTQRPWGHVLRSSLGAAAMFTSFATVARLSLAEATLLGYLAPLILVLLAGVVLGETVTRHRALGVALGFAGVLVLTLPDLGGAVDITRATGLALGVATAVLTAGALVQVRRLAATESPGAIAFYFVLVATLASLVTLPAGWVVPTGPDLVLLIGAGLFGGFAHIAMTLSFKLAEASRLAAFEYLTLGWAGLIDFALWGTAFGPAFWLALPLVLGGAAVAAAERPRTAAA
jgi:drug/metabolite transporter (DMT)-like permease